MISRLQGRLVQVSDSSAFVELGGMTYELLVPSGLAEKLRTDHNLGSDVSFDTFYFIEAQDKKTIQHPRLVGFANPIDREFFQLLTSVPGLGVRKVLKALILPIRDIATAIELKDAGTLSRLPGVGRRLADKIIAELNGKSAKFALSKLEAPAASGPRTNVPIAEEAMEVLGQLQYKPAEAEAMIRAALKQAPAVESVEELIKVIFKAAQSAKPTQKAEAVS